MEDQENWTEQDWISHGFLKLIDLHLGQNDRSVRAILQPIKDGINTARAKRQEAERAERRQRIAHCGTSHHFIGEHDHAGHD